MRQAINLLLWLCYAGRFANRHLNGSAYRHGWPQFLLQYVEMPFLSVKNN
jgi:hypothetical protein